MQQRWHSAVPGAPGATADPASPRCHRHANPGGGREQRPEPGASGLGRKQRPQSSPAHPEAQGLSSNSAPVEEPPQHPPQPLSEPPDRHDREPHRWQRKGASCVWNQGCRVLQARSGLKNHQACSLHTPGKGTAKRVTELSCPESYFRTWTPLFYVQVLDPLLHKADEQHLIEMRILGPHLRTTEPGTLKKNFNWSIVDM